MTRVLPRLFVLARVNAAAATTIRGCVVIKRSSGTLLLWGGELTVIPLFLSFLCECRSQALMLVAWAAELSGYSRATW